MYEVSTVRPFTDLFLSCLVKLLNVRARRRRIRTCKSVNPIIISGTSPSLAALRVSFIAVSTYVDVIFWYGRAQAERGEPLALGGMVGTKRDGRRHGVGGCRLG